MLLLLGSILGDSLGSSSLTYPAPGSVASSFFRMWSCFPEKLSHHCSSAHSATNSWAEAIMVGQPYFQYEAKSIALSWRKILDSNLPGGIFTLGNDGNTHLEVIFKSCF